MKYLTMTFAIAFMAFGFASITATPAQANESWECAQDGGQWVAKSGHDDECVYPSHAAIDDVDSLQQVAVRDDDRLEDCLTRENPDGMKLCVVNDEDGNEKVAGIEVPDGLEFADSGSDWGWWLICMSNPERCNGDENTSGENASKAEGEQFACHGNIRCKPTKTPTGTFYPLPMIDVASMDKLLAPGGTSVASFDKILAPGGTAVKSDYQFADREDGSGGDFGDSGGGDFGEGDRAAASTAAE